jgi:hypothetical protein
MGAVSMVVMAGGDPVEVRGRHRHPQHRRRGDAEHRVVDLDVEEQDAARA